MRLRFSIRALLILFALVAVGVVYWKSQQPKGIHGAGYRPNNDSVHYIVQSFSDQQQIELVLQKNEKDDPQFAPILIELSESEKLELLFQNEKFFWYDARIHPALSPQFLWDISNEIKSSSSWVCSPGYVHLDEKFCGTDAINVTLLPKDGNSKSTRYTLVVRKKNQKLN